MPTACANVVPPTFTARDDTAAHRGPRSSKSPSSRAALEFPRRRIDCDYLQRTHGENRPHVENGLRFEIPLIFWIVYFDSQKNQPGVPRARRRPDQDEEFLPESSTPHPLLILLIVRSLVWV
jgi:hypothetical protein